MSTLLIKNATVLVTMNENRDEIKDGAILIEDNQIQWVGDSAALDSYLSDTRPDLSREGVTKTIDASGCVVLPGLVNCHHHLYQTLTRTIGTGSGKVLFDWLKFLYPIWAELTPEAVYVSAKIGLSELILSGCTTVADHLYLYPNGSKIDDEIRAAQEVGVRFHPKGGFGGRGHGGRCGRSGSRRSGKANQGRLDGLRCLYCRSGHDGAGGAAGQDSRPAWADAESPRRYGDS
jgi:cytosine/adenosine deaminase-related metal-dependent hydrolase